ncbi:MAG: hypothetical protein ACJA1N_002484 [Saprospiraceae bacterium]|jgi:hypothetical protein
MVFGVCKTVTFPKMSLHLSNQWAHSLLHNFFLQEHRAYFQVYENPIIDKPYLQKK